MSTNVASSWSAVRSVCVAVLLAAPASVHAQEVIREWVGANGQGLGFAVSGLSDLDGDGKPEIALSPSIAFLPCEIRSSGTGALLFTVSPGPNEVVDCGDADGDAISDVLLGQSSLATVASGVDGHVIHKFTSPSGVIDHFGTAVAKLGDLDADGVADLAVGAPQTVILFPTGPGFVVVYSGRTGSELFTAVGDVTEDNFGCSVAGLDDVSGDGVPDLVVGACGPEIGTPPGYARALSGADGSTLWNIVGSASSTHLGRQVRTTEDVDHDGHVDLLVSSNGSVNGGGSGRVWILSGADGHEIAHVDGTAAGIGLGIKLANAGDSDGDGVHDLLLSTVVDQAWLVSGRTLLPLYVFEDERGRQTGFAVAGTADADGDGLTDLLLGDATAGGGGKGIATLHRGNDLWLDVTPNRVTAGDAVTRSVRTGVPGNLALIAIQELNGVPTWILTGGLRSFDGTGSIVDATTIPPGLAGLDVGQRAYAINAAGRIITSDLEHLVIE